MFFGARKMGKGAPTFAAWRFLFFDPPLREPSAVVIPDSDKIRLPSLKTAHGMLISPK